jgi:hypothetical protein
MKTGKSADSNGIGAERFKYGVDEIVPVIVNIINIYFPTTCICFKPRG